MIFQRHEQVDKQFFGRVDAAAFEVDAAASSSRVADAAASKMDATACSLPTMKTHFFWTF